MQITFVTGLALTLAWALATVLPPISAAHRSLHRRTLDPAESNSKGMKPVDIDWYVSLSLSLSLSLCETFFFPFFFFFAFFCNQTVWMY